MAQSLEMQAKIQLWREKSRLGTLTKDEMREAILALREDRTIGIKAAAAGKGKKAAGAKKVVNVDDLFNELGEL